MLVIQSKNPTNFAECDVEISIWCITDTFTAILEWTVRFLMLVQHLCHQQAVACCATLPVARTCFA